MTPINKQNPIALICGVILTLMLWLGLILQFYVSIPAYLSNGYSLAGALVQLFSFFTIQVNLLVALCLVSILLKPSAALYKLFSRGYVLTGIVVYIAIVCLVYNTVLRGLLHLTGPARVADELLHLINPVLFIIYWLIFIPKTNLKWAQSLNWLWYPFFYLVYTLIRGAITTTYPYPFVNAAKLGYTKVTINSLVMLVAFLLFGLLFILLSRRLASKSSKS
ncbi:Pr6Pr family membrane protein [Mucilaginibacter sp. SP1R1]|uniref:Pr6Pr family membrane protein n=1 Tax=Mucilaginibacter sp. SP1R1 TaxID=2723091 RepID=UPI001609CDB3|nr:Pr6Pr family membrane protein [Mucilaginibacter sp. SP1R1]MBB6149194.1 hypothetical protein [Mucilaginibacter sp. SP1R1]